MAHTTEENTTLLFMNSSVKSMESVSDSPKFDPTVDKIVRIILGFVGIVSNCVVLVVLGSYKKGRRKIQNKLIINQVSKLVICKLNQDFVLIFSSSQMTT